MVGGTAWALTMKCDQCGQEFLTAHSCQGAALTALEPRHSSSEGFALFHYLGEAWRIVLWDDAAVRRVKDDPRALSYGIVIWLLANALSNLAHIYPWGNKPRAITLESVLLSLVFVLFYSGVVGLGQIGILHLVAKHFCASKGKFNQVLRPLALASVVCIFQALPLFGDLIAGIAWIAVTVMVFNEVEGMPYLTAFLVSAAAGLGLEFLVNSVPRLP